MALGGNVVWGGGYKMGDIKFMTECLPNYDLSSEKKDPSCNAKHV